jgi:hypothetical protein
LTEAIAYARDGEGLPPKAEQSLKIELAATRLGVSIQALLSDSPLPARQIRSMTFSISGITTLLDESPRFGRVFVWSRGVLDVPGWTDEPPATLLELQGVVVVEVKDVEIGKLPPPSKRPTTPLAPTLDRRPMPPRAREVLAARLLRGRLNGAKDGRHQSGPAPYGYRRPREKVAFGEHHPLLEVDLEEADVVRRIFREYLRVRSMKRLVELLNVSGSRTRRNKEWSRAGVAWILKNDTYVGRVHFGEVKAHGRHPPIVSWIIFNKANKLIRLNDKRQARRARASAAIAVQAPGVQVPAEEQRDERRSDEGRP